MFGFKRKGRASSVSEEAGDVNETKITANAAMQGVEEGVVLSEAHDDDPETMNDVETPTAELADVPEEGELVDTEYAVATAVGSTGGNSEMPSEELTTSAYEAAPQPGLKNAEMHIGPGTMLKGDITTCESLMVQGNLNGTVDAAQMQIMSGGAVDGTATVQTAEIEGHFTGTLSVKGLLTVRGAGQVQGTIRYGELEVERGCHVSGDVAQNDAAAGSEHSEVRRFGRGDRAAGDKAA